MANDVKQAKTCGCHTCDDKGRSSTNSFVSWSKPLNYILSI